MLPAVRISYPALFKARGMKDDDGVEKDPRFSAAFILDKKEHRKIITEINAEVQRLAMETWGRVPKKFKHPIRDGAEFTDEDDELKDGYSDDVVGLSATSKNRPHVVGRKKEPLEEEDVYGGCYVNVVVTLYSWEHKTGGYGVSCNLGPVQFVKNGERFGGGTIDADEVFDELGEDDDDDEDGAPKKAKKPTPTKGKKRRPVDDDDDDFLS